MTVLSMSPAAIQRRRLRAQAAATSAAAVVNTVNYRKERAEAMHRIDYDYAATQARLASTRKCCTGCKTPFGICAHKQCRCHSF